MFSRLFLSFVCALFCTVGSADEKPNVLFLAVDDMNDWIAALILFLRRLPRISIDWLHEG